MSVHRTIAGALINKFQCKNKIAQLENFGDDFEYLLEWCKEIRVL